MLPSRPRLDESFVLPPLRAAEAGTTRPLRDADEGAYFADGGGFLVSPVKAPEGDTELCASRIRFKYNRPGITVNILVPNHALTSSKPSCPVLTLALFIVTPERLQRKVPAMPTDLTNGG